MSLMLNSFPNDHLKVADDGQKAGNISRSDLIATGRLLALEYNGRATNAIHKKEDYKPRLDDIGYANLSAGHRKKLLMFCAARAYAVEGKPAPERYDQVKNDLSLARNSTFLATLAGIVQEVITPVLPYVISNVGGRLMESTSIPLGQTKEVTIHSNDWFVFEDSSWGASRSASLNHLYDDTVTLNPRPYSCRVQIKWFQLVANDHDIGYFYNAIMAGYYNRIMANFTQAVTEISANANYLPDYLKFTTYNSTNWANAVMAVSAANRLPRNQLAAYGTYLALQQVLPKGTPSDAALTYGLGQEWMRNGFLAVVGGVPLFEVEQTLLPGTVNTTGRMMFPNDTIIIAGRPGSAYAPIYTGFAEGSPLVVEMNPRETGDMSIYIDCTAVMDTKVVMGSKIAVITNVGGAGA